VFLVGNDWAEAITTSWPSPKRALTHTTTPRWGQASPSTTAVPQIKKLKSTLAGHRLTRTCWPMTQPAWKGPCCDYH
jgi:hypothetical protein